MQKSLNQKSKASKKLTLINMNAIQLKSPWNWVEFRFIFPLIIFLSLAFIFLSASKGVETERRR